MIISPSRTEDQLARSFMLEAMEICLRNGLDEIARDIGKSSSILRKRIETKDYSKDDEMLRRIPKKA